MPSSLTSPTHSRPAARQSKTCSSPPKSSPKAQLRRWTLSRHRSQACSPWPAATHRSHAHLHPDHHGSGVRTCLRPNNSSRFGIGIKGHHDFTAGSYQISALFGAPGERDTGADAGLLLNIFDTSNNTITFNPGLSVAGLGIGLTGANDAALVDTSVFRLGGFKGYVFFDAEFKSGPLIDNFGLGMELDKLGLPLGLATGGNVGGNNPVASSLLSSNGGSASAPATPSP